MRYKSIRYDFHCTFTRENDCENNFYFFLQFDYFNPFSFNVIPNLTKNSLIAVESPLGEGWNTAKHKHVPQMAIRMKASNDFHSTISNNFFLTGFLSPMHQRAYGSLSMGGLAPTLLGPDFFGASSPGAAPFSTGAASPLAPGPGLFPFCVTSIS